jgi:hypothetical protein
MTFCMLRQICVHAYAEKCCKTPRIHPLPFSVIIFIHLYCATELTKSRLTYNYLSEKQIFLRKNIELRFFLYFCTLKQ